ncbi:MAG: PAS domain S-box protein [Candidatus Aminicenantes bacterium]|nr:PAS domain S-box protein [Candidatus Aminicenantes bacterium]
MGNEPTRDEILNVSNFLEMGFYRVTENGQFIYADSKARKFFGIPPGEADLAKHSITERYIFPAERELRIKKLRDSGGGPISSVISIRVKGETRLLFDQCWHDSDQESETCYAGVVKGIEDRVLFPKMFDEFPMGVYELDDNNNFAYFNKKAREILGFSTSTGLLGKNIGDFYVNEEDLNNFSERVSKDKCAHDVIKFKDVKGKLMEVECFTALIDEFEKARWGMIHDVTKRQRYFRALDKMPTAYYYIEYNKKEDHKHRGKIVHCNEEFAQIHGVSNKEDLIGRDITDFYADKEKAEEYYRHLEEEDKKGEAVHGYTLELKRFDNGEVIHVSVESHLVKQGGKVIGREGTLRNISDKIELERQVNDTKDRLDRITADINNLIHTFLHPVLKFSGHAELFQQSGTLLYQSERYIPHAKTALPDLGKQLEDKLTLITEKLGDISGISDLAAILKLEFEKIRNVLDYNLLRAQKRSRLLANAIRDAALWALEVLERSGFFNINIKKGSLADVFTDEFIQYLQDILFGYLLETSRILKGETEVMKSEVEALRRYINLGQKRKYIFKKFNLNKILEANIATFKPVMAQRDIEIDYTLPRKLIAKISENDIDRVICNILHNAQKYSNPGPGRFVKIKAKDLESENLVEIVISSLGIPIKKYELDSGNIFKFGYRGEMAYHTDRDGTGVGLADAQEVIEAHRGRIVITSEPVGDNNLLPNYQGPYITKVTIRLPKS